MNPLLVGIIIVLVGVIIFQESQKRALRKATEKEELPKMDIEIGTKVIVCPNDSENPIFLSRKTTLLVGKIIRYEPVYNTKVKIIDETAPVIELEDGVEVFCKATIMAAYTDELYNEIKDTNRGKQWLRLRNLNKGEKK